MPLDDGPPWVLKALLPVLVAGLVLFRLVHSKPNLSDGVSATDEIVIADLKQNINPVWMVQGQFLLEGENAA